ncbi:unnamed protein product [Bursaphelenchus okinawaensis]|uniref:Uncharacterized protein n=1 Tax=Bursaphelenchus okinawaensis TaxID=465554 RepID=A0A811LRS8_9BILA|nr:unnamed protein product [Bursaphelenchus okinawaensis]CAG9127232.1 unnamed protein product [Bursaphelenchus okinawaensis]
MATISDQIVIVKTKPIVSGGGKEWITENPLISKISEDRIAIKMFPLVPPMYLRQQTGNTRFRFDRSIEYLIVWSDTICCCGVVRNIEDMADTMPLFMRFGGHWSNSVHKIYMGCVVKVKSYLEVKGRDDKVIPIASLGSEFKDLFYGGVPFPSALASEWAIVKLAEVERSLGMLTEDSSYGRDPFMFLRGSVRDYEYNVDLIASYEKWPNIKKLPEVNSAVVLNYVKITDHVGLFTSKI